MYIKFTYRRDYYSFKLSTLSSLSNRSASEFSFSLKVNMHFTNEGEKHLKQNFWR